MPTMLERYFQPAPDAVACSDSKDGKMRYAPLFNLAWGFWIFSDLLLGGPVDREWVIATAISLPVFLYLYLQAYTRSRRYIGYFGFAVALLGYAVMPWNHSGGACYGIYACAFCAFVGTPRQSIACILLVIAGFVLCSHFQGWPWVATVAMTMVALSVGGGNLAWGISAQKNAELRLSNDEVRRLAALAERERIGRDLHDLLGHTLSLITIKSELANKLFDRDVAAAKREMADVERVARDALAQVRRAVTGIRAAGFAAELASARLLLESNSVRLSYELADVALPVEIETALAMTVREAVTNIQRHARATSAHITLQAQANQLMLRIEDNGRGSAIVPGNGLSGMRERLAGIGAELRIDSERGRGTVLSVSLPLPQAAQVSATTSPTLQSA
jgi:two-component system sensor histidine kinase DesK